MAPASSGRKACSGAAVTRLAMSVEDRTEEAFVRRILAGHPRPMEVDPPRLGAPRRTARRRPFRRAAVKAAYPRARDRALDAYRQDGICGTWEVLADAVREGGRTALAAEGWPASGMAKCEWAREIAPHVDPDRNLSPSFRAFRDGVRRLAGGPVS